MKTKSQLFLTTNNQRLLGELEIADTFVARGVGLLSRSKLDDNQGLWLKPGNSIHTLFMRFTIDCIFLNSDLIVKDLVSNVKPWRLLWPRWSSSSVIEVKDGFIEKNNLKIGDQLYVVS